MDPMDSAKSTMAVALADERLGKGWRRSRTRIRVAALLCSLVAAGVVYALFDRFGIVGGDARPPRELIAAIDLRVGNPAGAAERGAARAKADIEAGLLQLEVFGPALPAAKAQRLKRQGVAALVKGREATPLTQAHADAYNRLMQAEIERKLGREALEQVLRELDIPAAAKEAS